MSADPPANPFTSPVVLHVPGVNTVDVQRDVPWGPGDDRVFDLYRPQTTEPLSLAPVVVLVTGYPVLAPVTVDRQDVPETAG